MTFEKVFITVGTTKFDELIKVLCEDETLKALKELGCKQIKIQYGNSIEIDKNLFTFHGITADIYRFKKEIKDDISSADLVISHAGAGSCIEILRECKPLLVCINNELMDNHQMELAEQLSKEGSLYFCTPNNLLESLKKYNFSELIQFKRGSMEQVVKHLDQMLGFS